MCATFAGFTALGLLTYFMIYHICGEQSNIMQLQAEKQMLERNEEMIKLNQKNYEEMKTIRHDINNQCSYMQLMLSEKRYEELNKYFKNLYNEISKPVNFIDCGNRNISAILNLEIAKAQTEGVKIDTKIIVPPQFPFSDSDICSLLTNILDNAIEACVRNKIENPIIQAEIIQRQEYLFIYVTNPILGNLPQKNTTGFESSKKEKHLHGYGTKIIDKIAKKYNGQVKYSIKNNNFMVDVMLDLMINKSEEL